MTVKSLTDQCGPAARVHILWHMGLASNKLLANLDMRYSQWLITSRASHSYVTHYCIVLPCKASCV